MDFKNGVIHVKQQLQCKDGEYFFCTPKSGKGRTITPASIVMEALQQEWCKQRLASMEAGEAWDNPNDLVFTDALGKNLVRRTVVKHFKAVAQRVGVPDARFHDLRHSFAVTSLQAGDDIKTVQANLGHTVGDNGAEFVNIPDGAIVFNHLQSNALLENGRVSGRGRAMALGSAFVTGSIPIGIGGGNGGGSNYRPPSSGTNASVENNYSKELETFDWIEVAIDRIERIIDRFSKTASSAFKSLATRVNATGDEISMITQEISLQKRAYDKYMSAAEAVSLSADLKQLVRNGAIDISQYDQDTQKLINDYKDLYEKALDCSASIDDLHESLAQLYKDNFDNVQKDFENKLSLMEKRASIYNTKIDKLEEQGYLKNATYYKQLQNTQKSSIGVLNQELQSLQNALTQAIGSGEIEEGSEAWYEMQFAIEDTKAAIEEAELAVIKYDNAIREIGWEYFDYAQERIGQITSEADFLLNLLDSKDMYDANGNLSDAGIAANGVHAEKYGR